MLLGRFRTVVPICCEEAKTPLSEIWTHWPTGRPLQDRRTQDDGSGSLRATRLKHRWPLANLAGRPHGAVCRASPDSYWLWSWGTCYLAPNLCSSRAVAASWAPIGKLGAEARWKSQVGDAVAVGQYVPRHVEESGRSRPSFSRRRARRRVMPAVEDRRRDHIFERPERPVEMAWTKAECDRDRSPSLLRASRRILAGQCETISNS